MTTALWLLFFVLLYTRVSLPNNLFFTEHHSVIKDEEDYFHFVGPESAVVFDEPFPADSPTFFGYSIASYRQEKRNSLLIGAPKRNNEGAVYACQFLDEQRKFTCQNLTLELPDGAFRAPVPDGGFFGSSVAATTIEDRGVLLFCDHLFAFNASQRPRPSGLCNLREAAATAQGVPLDLCASTSCLSGFSSALRPSTASARLLLGIGLPDVDQGFGKAEFNYAPSDLSAPPAAIFTHVTPNRGAYLTGFAVALGHAVGKEALFVTDAGEEPKVEAFQRIVGNSSQLVRKAVELQQPNITGGIPGRFGFALTTANFAPQALPKQSSVLVGDPYFSVPGANLTNAGAVFLFCRQNQKPSVVFVGPQSGGLFGAALAEVSDVNGDGVPDFAVGCPYCDDGRGAVYVFPGRKDCSAGAPLSVMRAAAFGPNIRGFGWALAGGVDFDDNGSPDLAVGAPLSDTVVVAMSRPVVHAMCRQQGKCRLSETSTRPCAVIFIFRLDFGSNRPLNSFRVRVRTDFDIRKTAAEKRMSDNGKAVTEKLFDLTTQELSVRVTPKLNQKLFEADLDTPIEWHSTIILANATSTARDATGRLLPVPVLLATPCSSAPDIQNLVCGSGDCTTDLRVVLEAKPSPLVFQAPAGSVRLRLAIGRGRKEALRTRARLEFRHGAKFGSAAATKIDSAVATTCNVFDEEVTAVCSLAKILELELTLDINVDFSAAWKHGWRLGTPPMLRVEVLSSNRDINQTNNRLEVEFTADYRPNVTLAAHHESNVTVVDKRERITPVPRPIAYLENIGPRLHHAYLLSNGGPSPALGVLVFLELPLWSGGAPLLYLLPSVTSERGLIATGPRVLDEAGNRAGDCQVPDGGMNPHQLFVRENYEDLTIDILHDGSSNQTRWRRRRRRRRSVAREPGHFQCPGPGCVQIRCRVNRLEVGAVVRVVLDAWLWSPTVAEHQLTDVRVQSRAWGEVREAPAHLNLTRDVSLAFGPLNTTTSFVFSNLRAKERGTLPWIIMAIVIGSVLLTILIFVMYKCHFFERSRGETVQARRVSHVKTDDFL